MLPDWQRPAEPGSSGASLCQPQYETQWHTFYLPQIASNPAAGTRGWLVIAQSQPSDWPFSSDVVTISHTGLKWFLSIPCIKVLFWRQLSIWNLSSHRLFRKPHATQAPGSSLTSTAHTEPECSTALWKLSRHSPFRHSYFISKKQLRLFIPCVVLLLPNCKWS